MAKSRTLTVEIVGDSRSLDRTLGRSTQRMDRFGKSASKQSNAIGRSFRSAAKGAAGLAAGYASIAGAKKAVSTTSDLAKATIGLNKSLGLSVEKASQWAAVAKVRGIETKALNMAFGTLAKNSQKAAEGGNAQAEAFRKLGVTQKELKSLDFNSLLGEAADGMGKLKPGAEKTATAMQLFGRGWQTVVPVLREGSKGMREQLALATKYGATFSGGTVKSMQDFISAQREAKFASLGLQVAFGTQVAPALTQVIQGVAKLTREFRTLAKEKGVETAITEMLNRLAGSMAEKAPRIAESFVRGWFNASIWGKLLVGGWLLAKFGGLGAFARLGNRSGTAFGTGMASGIRNSRLGVNILGAVAVGVALVGPDLAKLGNKLSGGFLFAGWKTGMERIKRDTGRVLEVVKKFFGDAVAGILRRFAMLFDVAAKIPGIGGKFRGVGDAIRRAAGRADQFGEAVDRAGRKRVTARVRLKFDIPGVGKNLELPGVGGSGMAVDKGIQLAAQEYAANNRGRFAALFEGQPGVLGRAKGSLGKAEEIARRFGLVTTSGYRPGDKGWHGRNRARDFGGSAAAMLKFAKYMYSTHGSNLLELIHTPLGRGIKNGRSVPNSFYASVLPAHYNHVHVAMQRGGLVPGRGTGDKVPALLEPGEGMINRRATAALGGKGAIDAINRMVPRFQKGGTVGRVISAAKGAGFKGRLLRIMSAIALGESGGNPRARGDGGASHGLWQIYTRAHPWTRSLNLFDPQVNAKAAMRVYRSQGLGAWTVYREGIYKRHLGAVDRALKAGGGKGRADSRIFQFSGGRMREGRLVARQIIPQKGRPFRSPHAPRDISQIEAPEPLTGDPGGTDGPSGPSPAEQLAEQMKALAEQVAALKVETAERNRITSSTLAIGLREAERALADMIAGQLGTMVSQRGRGPSSGARARY